MVRAPYRPLRPKPRRNANFAPLQAFVASVGCETVRTEFWCLRVCPGSNVRRTYAGCFGLSFATAEALEERIRELLESEPGSHAVVLDFAGVDFIDSQGSEKLSEIRQLTEASDATLRIARIKPQVRTLLEADGVIDQLGIDHIHGNVYEAVEAAQARQRDP